jgi:CofD-related protein of GAK system
MDLSIKKTVKIPNPLKLARFAKTPELGPRLLFFSGGSALRDLSKTLPAYTHNSIHLMTPFDSGGSSAIIRKEFKMLSVGDLRTRLMALADQTVQGNPDIYKLFSFRFSKESDNKILHLRLLKMIQGDDPLILKIWEPMSNIIRSHLHYFQKKMGKDFDLRGASIGNLILAGGFLNNNRDINPVIFLFSKLVEVRGYVRPTSQKYLHLGAELMDGTMLIGQHLLTGKEVPPINSPIKDIFISSSSDQSIPITPAIDNKIEHLISVAELICYPMGSFYTSVIANLLPSGTGSAIAKAGALKIYIPSMGNDPEQLGMNLSQSILTLAKTLGAENSPSSILDFVLIDSKRGNYSIPMDTENVTSMGIKIIDINLVTEISSPWPDPEILASTLLSLC